MVKTQGMSKEGKREISKKSTGLVVEKERVRRGKGIRNKPRRRS